MKDIISPVLNTCHNHEVEKLAEHETTKVDVVSVTKKKISGIIDSIHPLRGDFLKIKMLHLFDFIQFVNFMSTNSINIGFDMESMKCAANKSAKVDFVFDKGTKPYLEDANVFH